VLLSQGQDAGDDVSGPRHFGVDASRSGMMLAGDNAIGSLRAVRDTGASFPVLIDP
jgi:hypothetical protein